jgi:acyl carrier protein
MSVVDNLREFIIDELAGEGIEDVGPDDELLASGLLDSFGLERLISFLEQSYGIELSPAELEPADFRTVRSIEQLVERRRGA